MQLPDLLKNLKVTIIVVRHSKTENNALDTLEESAVSSLIRPVSVVLMTFLCGYYGLLLTCQKTSTIHYSNEINHRVSCSHFLEPFICCSKALNKQILILIQYMSSLLNNSLVYLRFLLKRLIFLLTLIDGSITIYDIELSIITMSLLSNF